MNIRKGDTLVSRFPPLEEMKVTKIIKSHELVELERLCQIEGHVWADYVVLPLAIVEDNYYLKGRTT